MQAQGRVAQLFAESALSVQYRIERLVDAALRAVGPTDNAHGVRQAWERMRDHSPLYVKRIVIHGLQYRDMYSDRPGSDHFDVDACVNYDAPPYCGVAEAKRLALAYLDAADKTARQREEVRDGDFAPQWVELLSQFDTPVAEYHLGSPDWDATQLSGAECMQMEDNAAALEERASEEARYDNFQTARHLRNRVDAIRRKIAISRSMSRLMA